MKYKIKENIVVDAFLYNGSLDNAPEWFKEAFSNSKVVMVDKGLYTNSRYSSATKINVGDYVFTAEDGQVVAMDPIKFEELYTASGNKQTISNKLHKALLAAIYYLRKNDGKEYYNALCQGNNAKEKTTTTREARQILEDYLKQSNMEVSND